MMLLLVTQAFAGEKVERLDGVHLGIGAGLTSYTTYSIGTSAGESLNVNAPTATASLRVRLSPGFTLEPIVGVGYGTTAYEVAGDVTGRVAETAFAAGLRVRPRIAQAGNADLVAMVGGDYGVGQGASYDADGKETYAAVANTVDLDVGLGLELWVLPRLSVGADLEASVLEWSHDEGRPEGGDKEVSEALAVGLNPRPRLVVAFYL